MRSLDAGPFVFYGAGAPVNLSRPFGPPLAAVATLRYLAACRECVPCGSKLIAHWLLPAGLAAWELSQRKGCRYQMVIHGSDATLLSRLPFGPRLIRAVCERADDVLAVSETVKERLLQGQPTTIRRNLDASIRVCPMGTDLPEDIADACSSRLLWLGRMHEGKGGRLLLRALSEEAVSCDWLGDGPARMDWEALAKRTAGNHSFHGMLPADRVGDFLRIRPLVVFTATEPEGAPLSLTEAMAYGCPIVAPRCPPFSQTLQDQTDAMLYTPHNVEDLRRIVRLALRHPSWSNELGRRARNKARELAWFRLSERLRPVWSEGNEPT